MAVIYNDTQGGVPQSDFKFLDSNIHNLAVSYAVSPNEANPIVPGTPLVKGDNGLVVYGKGTDSTTDTAAPIFISRDWKTVNANSTSGGQIGAILGSRAGRVQFGSSLLVNLADFAPQPSGEKIQVFAATGADAGKYTATATTDADVIGVVENYVPNSHITVFCGDSVVGA